MKKTYQILTIMIASLILSSCGKDGATLSGTVLENGNEAPIEGVQVQIIAGKSTGLFEPPIEWLTATATTNKSGKFKIRVEDASYYKVGRFIKDGYFEVLGSHNKKAQNTSIDKSGVRKNPTFYLDPAGTLHVVVENDPMLLGDFINTTIPGHSGSIGTFSFFENYYTIRANRYEKYNYRVDQNAIYNDSVFVIAFDTTQLKIVF